MGPAFIGRWLYTLHLLWVSCAFCGLAWEVLTIRGLPQAEIMEEDATVGAFITYRDVLA